MTLFPLSGARPRLRGVALLAVLVPLLGGCKAVVLDPAGDVATRQAHLIIAATVLMLLIIIPVMVLTVLFARKYRASNEEATYEPEWEHSTQLELVIWSAPLLIIIALGAVTWTGTHKLDPYHPIERISKGKPVPPGVTPLDVQVVALDWKWLFIYPQYGIATVNDLAAPIDRPIHFYITASSVMNSFFIPALAGQIYAMPSMETKLNAVVNKPGTYKGFSANYSGDGFSNMRFSFHGLSDAQFQQWISQAKASPKVLDRASYLALAKPSQAVPVIRYSKVAPGDLYQLALNNCVKPGTPCIVDQMRKNILTAQGKPGGAVPMAMTMTYSKHLTVPKAIPALAASGPLRGAGLIPPGERSDHQMIADSAPASRAQSSL